MTSKEKFDWIKENISIVDYASSIGFTPVRKGKYYSLKEHDSIIIDTHKNIYCKIVKQDENSYMQISFPDGKKQWIERKDEEITKDGKYVKLRVIRYFNRINQLKSEVLMDTWIKTDR